jgi:hypothetical protein
MALTPAQKQKAYRDRKRAKRDALVAEAARIAEAQRQHELVIVAERDRAAAEALRQERLAAEEAREREEQAARRAEEEAKARGIADGTLHPSGRPWRNGDVRAHDAYSPRAMQEAGRRAVLQQASDAFDRTGFLTADPFGPRRRPEPARAPRIRYDWHRDY